MIDLENNEYSKSSKQGKLKNHKTDTEVNKEKRARVVKDQRSKLIDEESSLWLKENNIKLK